MLMATVGDADVGQTFVLIVANRSSQSLTGRWQLTFPRIYIADTQCYIQEALTRAQRAKTLLREKLKLVTELFQTEDRQKVYIYRVGTEAPTPKIERALVPLTAEGLPDFTAQTTWECFGFCP